MSEPRLPSEDWHWDNDRHRWVYMGNYGATNPTYRWELTRNAMVYENELMMDAIDLACKNMQRFPDAETLLRSLDQGPGEL